MVEAQPGLDLAEQVGDTKAGPRESLGSLEAADLAAREEWAILAARAAASKTDEETLVLDVGSVLAITGAFVITAGRTGRQVKALADEIEMQIKLAGGPGPKRREGLDALEWVLLDYGDFVVHIFHVETRKYYELERLWADVPRIAWRADA